MVPEVGHDYSCSQLHLWLSAGRITFEMVGREFGEPLLTVGEVAHVMRVSNMTVYRLIKAGHLPAIRVGKNYRIRRGDVDRYLDERRVSGLEVQ